jgi:mitochondrial fission protein ELM1
MSQRTETPPRVWVLLGKGVGGNRQMRCLAEALGWPYECKPLVYNALNRCPNLLLGASAISVDRGRSSPLAPPWPDLVIAASRRSAPVARWIKRRSGGQTRLVHLLHTQAPLAHFDLVITMPQYRLPARANVLHAAGPLIRLDAEQLAAARARWAPRFAGLPRPYTALLVGGDSSSYHLDPATAARLGREAVALVGRQGGALLVSTSARTPPAAADALVGVLDVPRWVYRWRPEDRDNPYLGYLALADRFVVTVDSASLLAEACTTGKPVLLFEWPRRRPRALSLSALLARWDGVGGNGRGARPRSRPLFDRLVYLGLVKPSRDIQAFYGELMARGLVSRLGAPPAPGTPLPLDDMERALERIRALMRWNQRDAGVTTGTGRARLPDREASPKV